MTAPAVAAELRVRAMARPELDLLLDWAAAEGWNPGLHDAEPFWTADPGGYLAALRDGELVGGGSIVSYDGRFGFMGFFIVRPPFRGHGLGAALWRTRRDRLLDRLLPGACIGLDGVEAMVPFYARGGFRLAHRDRRHRFTGGGSRPDGALVPASSVPLDELAAFDAARFPAPRPAFLASWISRPGVVALCAVEGSRIVGLGVLRPCREGRKIGPLLALDATVAASLLDALSAAAPGEPIFLDVPESNPAAMALARARGMREVFGCARMYLGPPPRLPGAEVFGVTSFELG